ncbi:hypothetical protein Ahy_B06g082176 [Arachis hypogaea]|uniref:Aminotransferase-like plant mobile domain-containing protein n=1 Tax=Arachis hypogaea TaxID=3818 RepID=A0A444YMX2_ARAHY|nr:hypothetical protein Ahy_B06g082176 [Arachis hypogaea]
MSETTDPDTLQQYARCYIMLLIGGYLMTDKSNTLVHHRWLPLLADFQTCQEGHKISIQRCFDYRPTQDYWDWYRGACRVKHLSDQNVLDDSRLFDLPADVQPTVNQSRDALHLLRDVPDRCRCAKEVRDDTRWPTRFEWTDPPPPTVIRDSVNHGIDVIAGATREGHFSPFAEILRSFGQRFVEEIRHVGASETHAEAYCVSLLEIRSSFHRDLLYVFKIFQQLLQYKGHVGSVCMQGIASCSENTQRRVTRSLN